MEDFGFKGRSGGGLRWMILKGWETIIGAEMRVGRTSPPHIDTGESEVRFMSGERLLESREEGSRKK